MELDNYYTPKVEEFIKGFEYEIKSTFRFGFLDLTGKGNSKFSEDHINWHKRKLDKDWDEKYIFNSFDLKTYLENNTIRAKLK